jgi:hypothetical protein
MVSSINPQTNAVLDFRGISTPPDEQDNVQRPLISTFVAGLGSNLQQRATILSIVEHLSARLTDSRPSSR